MEVSILQGAAGGAAVPVALSALLGYGVTKEPDMALKAATAMIKNPQMLIVPATAGVIAQQVGSRVVTGGGAWFNVGMGALGAYLYIRFAMTRQMRVGGKSTS